MLIYRETSLLDWRTFSLAAVGTIGLCQRRWVAVASVGGYHVVLLVCNRIPDTTSALVVPPRWKGDRDRPSRNRRSHPPRTLCARSVTCQRLEHDRGAIGTRSVCCDRNRASGARSRDVPHETAFWEA